MVFELVMQQKLGSPYPRRTQCLSTKNQMSSTFTLQISFNTDSMTDPTWNLTLAQYCQPKTSYTIGRSQYLR